MQYKETLPAALPESTHYDKRDRQTDFSNLALIFTGAGGWWGFLSNILYRLPTVDVGDNSLLPLFRGTVQLSLNCMKNSFEVFLTQSMC